MVFYHKYQIKSLKTNDTKPTFFESYECPHCVISSLCFAFQFQLSFCFLPAGLLRIHLPLVPHCSKLELTGGKWLLPTHNVSGSLTQDLGDKQEGDQELSHSRTLSPLKVNMSFILTQQVFIRLIATLQSCHC